MSCSIETSKRSSVKATECGDQELYTEDCVASATVGDASYRFAPIW